MLGTDQGSDRLRSRLLGKRAGDSSGRDGERRASLQCVGLAFVIAGVTSNFCTISIVKFSPATALISTIGWRLRIFQRPSSSGQGS